jgi:hypothetical protein
MAELSVAECLIHGVCFTLYPASLAPYLRTALVAPGSGEEAGSFLRASSPPLDKSPFRAAAGAATGQQWQDRDAGHSGLSGELRPAFPWRRSRMRQLSRLEEWLGLSATVSPEEQMARAEVLGVETVRLRELAGRSASSASVQQRGEAVCEVVSALGRSGCQLERLMWAGHQAGLWAAPWFWDERSQSYRPCRFRASGVTPSEGDRLAVKRPTTLSGSSGSAIV